MDDALSRVRLLVGEDGLEKVRAAKVIIFGCGGVGSWCAEGLVRSGVRHLTLVDPDCVAPSNLNRQMMAVSSTVGLPKVIALRSRLLDIAPDASIDVREEFFSSSGAASFGLSSYDYIIDAIDSLKDKAELILRACEAGGVFFSSMGAACKIDPTRVRTAEFFEVRGCPLGSALRKKLRRARTLPAHPFTCVYSDELLPNVGSPDDVSIDSYKAVTNGSLVPVTATFGFTLSSLVLRDILGI